MRFGQSVFREQFRQSRQNCDVQLPNIGGILSLQQSEQVGQFLEGPAGLCLLAELAIDRLFRSLVLALMILLFNQITPPVVDAV
jgi:hypothetical protein